MLTVKISFIFLLSVLIVHQVLGLAGPYKIDVDILTHCEDQGTDECQFRLQKYYGIHGGKKKMLHRGSFIFPFEEAELDQIKIVGEFYIKKNNDFLFTYKYEGDFCKTLEGPVHDFYKEFRKVCGAPEEGCGFEMGKNFTIDDWYPDFKLAMPVLEYGTYRGFFKFYHRGEMYSCILMECQVKKKF